MNENMKTRSVMTGISMLKIDGIGIRSLINNNNKTGNVAPRRYAERRGIHARLVNAPERPKNRRQNEIN